MKRITSLDSIGDWTCMALCWLGIAYILYWHLIL